MSESGSSNVSSSVYSGDTGSTYTMQSQRYLNVSDKHNEQTYLLFSDKKPDQRNILARVWAFLTRCIIRMRVENNEPDEENVWNSEDIDTMDMYLKRKTIGLGLLVFALFSSNVIQMRNIVAHSEQYKYFQFVVPYLGFNIILQFIALNSIIYKCRFNLNNLYEYAKASYLNEYITILIIVMTVNNILISLCSISSTV
ncbi:unnamed protein product [Chironomus riparius]|uniref:Uncharacterized protein n=1 Tax=Chironomus riparius TaxID=315576 RepID=A0A9N9WLN5_9DIPT|nr:unnamed protein product [Chironomus riparius]